MTEAKPNSQPAPPTQSTTALAVTPQGGALAETPQGGALIDYAADEGDGSTVGRDIDVQKIIIPRMIILQDGTPLCKKTSSEYIEGLEDGNFYNLQTKMQFDGKTGIRIVVSEYYSDFEERSIPQKEGDQGELIAIHRADSDIHRASRWVNKRFVSPDGNPMIERFNIFGLLLENENQDQFSRICFRLRIAHKSIKSVISDLMTALGNWYEPINGKMVKMPCYAGIYRIVLRPEKNEKNSWWVPVLFSEIKNGVYKCRELVTDQNLYDNGRSFRKLVQAGEVISEEAPVQTSNSVDTDQAPF